MKEKLNDQEDTEDTERKRGDSTGWKGRTIYFGTCTSLRPFRKAKDEVQVPQG
jgi:hypothetical protein